jgi:hypothetical protein
VILSRIVKSLSSSASAMATVNRPDTHREELSVVLDAADRRFAAVAVAVTLGTPLVAYLSGVASLLFYVHVALGAFWFGMDFFFKFVLGPSLDAAPDEAAGAVNAALVPKLLVVAEPLSLGVVASGIGLADLFGYWADPTVWLWAALGVSLVMLAVGFGPLHLLTTKLSAELARPDPDGERVESLLGRTMQWGLLQTVLMLAVVGTMVGLRGLL